MKKIACILSLVLLVTVKSFAQTNVFPTTGKVGIGTTSPVEMLQIQGATTSLKFNPDFTGQTMIYSHNGTTYTPLTIQGSDLRFNVGTVEKMRIDPNGRLGIGTAGPQAGLHVKAVGTQADGTLAAAILGDGYNQYTYFGGSTGGRIRGSGSEGYLVLESYVSGSNNTLYLNTTSNGNVSIGNGGGKVIVGNLGVNHSDNSYKLFVQTGIRTEKIKVDLTSQWSDFVFHKDYSLKPLDEVESFIKQNKHLPDIPSENEVKTSGIDLGEMNAKLLQKIEELTLYIIEQDKTIKEQGKKLAELEKKIN